MARIMQLLSRRSSRANSKLSPKLTALSRKRIELRVPMCCEYCEENVRQVLISLEGVKEISLDVKTQKVTVLCHYDEELEPHIVLIAVKKIKHKAELWKE